MKNILKYHGLWIIVWMLIVVVASIDLLGSHSPIDILTMILGILMICYNYKDYRKTMPKNGDVPYGQI